MKERESDTRLRRIDPKLEAAGWAVSQSAGMTLETSLWPTALAEFPTSDGSADYALCVAQRVSAVVEAKKLTVGPHGVLAQAERYSRGIKQQPRFQGEYGVPFLYSTNGEQIRFHDVRREHNRSRWVSGFHTPAALGELLEHDFDAELQTLAGLAWNAQLRPYQRDANAAIERAIGDGKRKLLVTMATGTGKTLMTVNEIYRLMTSGAARRVLFLVDRRALAAQTFAPSPRSRPSRAQVRQDLPALLAALPASRSRRRSLRSERDAQLALTAPKLGDAFVYVSTIQRMMMNLFGRWLLAGQRISRARTPPPHGALNRKWALGFRRPS